MAKCHPSRNDVGSLILNHQSSHNHNHHYCRIWSSFSFRKLLATVSCGGSSISTKNKSSKTHIKKPGPKPEPNPKLNPTNGLTRPEYGKLVDLLNLSSSSCSSGRREKVEVEKDLEEVRRKEVRLEELREAVRLLSENNEGERENGAKKVRSLAKEDSEARSTLAMLGAIPPLVALLDHRNDECLIQALYALLNLGIGNDL